jgi:DNA-binding MarR family transcriptional regulator
MRACSRGQRSWRPPVAIAEQLHQGRDEQGADDRGVEEHGERAADAELLEEDDRGGRERADGDAEQQDGGGNDAARFSDGVAVIVRYQTNMSNARHAAIEVTAAGAPSRANLGFELAKASQRWNELLHGEFTVRGFGEVRPAYGSVMLPLFEQDGLRMGELAARARLSKQTMTTLIRLMERAGLVERTPDPQDGRAVIVGLTPRAREFGPVAGEVVASLEQRVAERLSGSDYGPLRAGLRAVMEL